MSAYDRWKTTDVQGDYSDGLEQEAERRFLSVGIDFNTLTEEDWEAMYESIEEDIADSFQEPDRD